MKREKPHLFLPDYGDIHDPKIRAKYGYLEALVSIIGNISLFSIKIFLAYLLNSISLAADAVHSLSDVTTSGIVIFGFRISKKQPDKRHPFGHGRAEQIATLIISVLLIVIGINFIQRSIERILNPRELTNPNFIVISIIIIFITVIVKEILARYSSTIAKLIDSEMLHADAWHHRTDAISSIVVGIGLIGSYFGYFILDALFGIIVSVIIIYIGIILIKKTSDYLIGSRPKKDLINTLEKIVYSTPEVYGIHSIYVHDYGHIKILTMHLEMNGKLTMEKAHTISDDIEKRIRKITHYFPVIHIEPTGIHK